jgi:ABC-type multidrug transport system ATPase subunit
MDEAERCDIVHLLDKGKLFSKGTPSNLLENAKAKTFDEYYLNHTKEVV